MRTGSLVNRLKLTNATMNWEHMASPELGYIDGVVCWSYDDK